MYVSEMYNMKRGGGKKGGGILRAVSKQWEHFRSAFCGSGQEGGDGCWDIHYTLLKLNSRTYNFDEVSGHNLEVTVYNVYITNQF
jgi:hypothetical protein